MVEYALSAFGILAILGALSLLSYGSGRAESLSLAIICLFVLASPIVSVVGNLRPENFFEEIKIPDSQESGYDAVVEDAFAQGIARAVADKFSLPEEKIRVSLRGFDPEKMSAEKIRIVLSGVAALADYKAIESYIDGLSMGECSVEIEIG